MDQNINDSQFHVSKSFFENIISGIQLFYSCSNVPVEIDFFDIKFSSRKSQSQPKLAKKITHFKIKLWSKNLTHFTNLNSLDVENKMLLQHSQKPFWLVSVQCQKKHLHCTISCHPRTAFLKHFESKCLRISVYLC